MQSSVNHRKDKYGGPIENRVRFALEVCFWAPEAFPSRLIVVLLCATVFEPHMLIPGHLNILIASIPVELFICYL